MDLNPLKVRLELMKNIPLAIVLWGGRGKQVRPPLGAPLGSLDSTRTTV